MTDLSHYVSGARVAGPIRPVRGCVQPGDRRRREAGAARHDRGGRRGRRGRQGGLAGLGEDPAAAPRAHPRQVQVPADRECRQDRRADLGRARQDPRRRARRGDPRPRGGRVRRRHPAPAEGRGHRERRHQRRQPLAAPAARGRRRHHAVQLPLHGADVDVPGRARLRQRLHPEALRARSVGAAVHRRAADAGRGAGRRLQRRQRRQGGGRRAADAPRRQGGELRRLDADRALHLCDRHRERKAGAGAGRRQEPRDHPAGRRHRHGGRRADGRGLRLGRRALHGDLGGGAGRRGDREPADREARAEDRGAEDRAGVATGRRTWGRWSPRSIWPR